MYTKEVRRLGELIEAESEARARFRTNLLWFRGQAHSSWKLLPGVFRRKTLDAMFEQVVLKLFKQRAMAYRRDTPPDHDYSGWLALAQHYRMPTRLLDWSESIGVSAYFALERGSVEGDAAVWVLNPFALNTKAGIGPALVPGDWEDIQKVAGQAFMSGVDAGFPKAFMPRYQDSRLAGQRAAFTVHPNNTAMDDLEDLDTMLAKLIIPSDAVDQMRLDLFTAGVRATTLFPDLEGLVGECITTAEIQGRYTMDRQVEEIEQKRLARTNRTKPKK